MSINLFRNFFSSFIINDSVLGLKLLFLIIFILIFFIISNFPFLILLTMIFFSVIPALHFITYMTYGNISNKSKEIIENLLKICLISGILNIAFDYYTWL